MRTSLGIALPRVGLLGNPSDGYGGRVISCTFRDFAAKVRVADAPVFDFAGTTVASWDGVAASMGAFGGLGGLLIAGIRRLASWFGPDVHAELRAAPFRVEVDCDIPREVGFAGSSAIVIAEMRAMLNRLGRGLPPHRIAELALAAEVEDLGIAGGPQDRVVQAYEGLLYMDFAEPRDPSRYRRLDTDLMPSVFVAWDPAGAVQSGRVHGRVRGQFDDGDGDVHRAMARFPALADQGLRCLETGDHGELRRLVNENFDLRSTIWDLRERDFELVDIGRSFGAAVKFCGSGGAVVGVMANDGQFSEIAAAYRGRDFSVLRPDIGARVDEVQTA